MSDVEALAAIHLCRVRATRLNTDGTAKSGANNMIVSDTPMVVNVTPEIEAGQDKTLIGGCDCIIATYRGYDKLKRWNFEFDEGELDPALQELMTGATAIAGSGSEPGGIWFSEQAFDCSSAVQPPVAFEGWQTGWEEDEQSVEHPYVHWIWPRTFWQFGALSLQNDFTQPKLTGFSRGNTGYGLGKYGDLPEEAGSLGGWFWDDDIPAATNGYGTVPS